MSHTCHHFWGLPVAFGCAILYKGHGVSVGPKQTCDRPVGICSRSHMQVSHIISWGLTRSTGTNRMADRVKSGIYGSREKVCSSVASCLSMRLHSRFFQTNAEKHLSNLNGDVIWNAFLGVSLREYIIYLGLATAATKQQPWVFMPPGG